MFVISFIAVFEYTSLSFLLLAYITVFLLFTSISFVYFIQPFVVPSFNTNLYSFNLLVLSYIILTFAFLVGSFGTTIISGVFGLPVSHLMNNFSIISLGEQSI